MSDDPDAATVAAAIMAMAAMRGEGRSFCPSEVARRLAADWRPLLPRIRATAAELVCAGRLEATQRGRAVDPLAARGPIRLKRPG